MCGISGFYSKNSIQASRTLDIAKKMESTLVHRGPDSGGMWIDQDYEVALIHRRLAIVDLSPLGHQPMISSDDRFVICYNGEIYNSGDIKSLPELSKKNWRGHSDTETILETCAILGVKAATQKLIGMFAFALWDKAKRELWLVRDRLGIKPLYWTITPSGSLIFGSELKALRAHPDCPSEIDRDAVAGFMRHNYVAGPRTIYKGICKLEPGHILRYCADMHEPKLEKFWDLDEFAFDDTKTTFSGNDEEAVDALEGLLSDSVSRRMIADVPLGAFLSGGIDSSVVAALMQAQRGEPIKTFSIGFETQTHNEAIYAAEVAKHLGTDHTELYVTGQDALEVIPKLPEMFDEPFADSSQIPTYLLCSLTRKHVTVALSGDGGDELFAGYERYFTAQRVLNKLNRIPPSLRHLIATAIKTAKPNTWNILANMVPKQVRPTNAGYRAHKLAAALMGGPDVLFRSLISHWDKPDDLVIGGAEPKGILWDETLASDIPDFMSRMQYMDSVTYLTDDILTKVDRASMFDALEARVPILDHRVVEFAATLPNHMKVRNGQGKWILRQVLERHVPRHLFERPKMGFGVPLEAWLRGPLREWAEDLLSQKTFDKHGLLRRAPVISKWHQHVAGHANHQYLIWDVLMLHAWANKYI